MRLIKSYLKRTLPPRVVHMIKKVRYTRAMRRVSESSEFDLRVIRHLIEQGDNVIDVGANMGMYTKYMSDLVGNDGCVYSIEPIRTTFEILDYMTKKLGLENVELLNYAISDSNGTVTMEIPFTDSGEPNIYEARIIDCTNFGVCPIVQVASRTLDSLFSALPKRIAFIKCDVEGHELSCLKGATIVLRRFRPSWLIEIWGDLDDTSAPGHETLTLLRQEGYDCYWFDGSRLRKRQRGDRSRNGNYLFLTAEHVNDLRNRDGFGLEID